MSKIIFIYRKNKYEMTLDNKNPNVNIFNEYSKKIDGKMNALLFLYKGKNISLMDSKMIINKFKSIKNIIISVYNSNINYKIDNINENSLCPDCKNLTFFNFNNKNIISNCKNKHINKCKYEYTSITEFMNSQIIDEKDIECNICNNNKYLYGNNFYICSCHKKLCQLCINKHEKNDKHNLIYFNKRYSICNNHHIEFISYCSICNLNLCEKCEKKHEKHRNKIILYKKEIPNEMKMNEIKKEIDLIKLNINQYKKEINEHKNLFNYFIKYLIEDIDNYIKLYDKILSLSDNLKNYQSIKNILNYKNISLNKDINIFLNENIKNKMKYLLNKLSEYINEISLTYNINNNKIKFFDEKFIENNKDNFILLVNNKIMDIFESYNIEKEMKDKYIKLKLIQKNKVFNLSYMFSDCESLSSIENMSKLDTNSLNNISHMFSNCKSLSSIDDISKWNTNNIIDMSYLFSNCILLSSLPDISKWNTSNNNNMSHIFYNCKSLLSLPDLSRWKTNNVNNISYMFYNCKLLSSLPDISNWNTNNIKDLNNISPLPDISNSNTNNMSYMFYNCRSLSSLPDISNWNTNNIKDMS